MAELWMPLLAGLLTASVAGPVGSLLLWRRMAYFGDSLAHASLLGVALALMWDMPVGPAVAGFTLLLAWFLGSLFDRQEHGADTWLAITAYSGMSLALLVNSLGHDHASNDHDHGHGHDLEDYLFGDISSIDGTGFIALLIGTLVIAVTLWRFWPAWLAMSVHEESARVDGWPVAGLRRLLILLLATLVAIGAKVMGVLLISALLVIPAAAARYLASHPSEMAVKASLLGMLSVFAGTLLGLPTHLPVAALTVVFALLTLCISMARQRWR